MVSLYKSLLVILRILAILSAILIFGWYNIFVYLVISDTPKLTDIIWLQAGFIYCAGTLITAFNWDFKHIIHRLYLLFSFVLTLILSFDLLFSLLFSQIRLMVVDLLLLCIIGGNGWLVMKKKTVFAQSRWVLGVVVLIGLIGTGLLNSRWDYFATKIECKGVSMTTAGNYEPWSYYMPRLQCWGNQLSSS